MKAIINTTNIKLWDQFTIQNEPVSSADLMERAAEACFDWLCKHIELNANIVVACGTGNNGGDGLVIARKLIQNNYNVTVVISGDADNGSPDFKFNLHRLNLLNSVELQIEPADFSSVKKATVIIDALFGTGLNKPITGYASELIRSINSSTAEVIAIDMPSGMFADETTPSTFDVVKADYTLSFQVPKLGFFMPENDSFVGKFVLLDIQLSSDFNPEKHTQNFWLERTDFGSNIFKRSKHDNKWNFGHALLLGGSENKSGAVILAARSALRCGAGLLTVHTVKSAQLPLLVALPEAMLDLDSNSSYIADVPDFSRYTAIGIGPGIGTEEQTALVLESVLTLYKGALVIDADALNIISERNLHHLLPENCLLTPHVREFERLAGTSTNSFERCQLQSQFSAKYKVYVLLKGAYSCLSTPDGRLLFNSSGNPGMAKGGSGDCLTGIITSFAAQGMSIEKAASLGMMVHGMAGDLASARYGETSMLPSDLIEALPEILRKFN